MIHMKLILCYCPLLLLIYWRICTVVSIAVCNRVPTVLMLTKGDTYHPIKVASDLASIFRRAVVTDLKLKGVKCIELGDSKTPCCAANLHTNKTKTRGFDDRKIPRNSAIICWLPYFPASAVWKKFVKWLMPLAFSTVNWATIFRSHVCLLCSPNMACRKEAKLVCKEFCTHFFLTCHQPSVLWNILVNDDFCRVWKYSVRLLLCSVERKHGKLFSWQTLEIWEDGGRRN